MKTIIRSFALFAVAATAALSCQKNEIENPEQDTIHFTINADIAQTKTSIVNNGDGTYTPQWSKGDEIGVYFSSSDGSLVSFTNGLDTGETARFEGNADVPEAGTLYAFYPYSSYGKKYEDGRVRLDLSATQYPSATSFDPNCDILVAKPQEYETISSNTVIADLSFARVMSVLKVNLKGEFEREQIVKSFSFTAEGVNLAGYAAMDLENAEITEWTNTTTSTVSAIYQTEDVQIGGTSNSVYLVVAPVDIPENTTLTFNVETDDYYISKTVSEHGKISFPSGNIAVIDLTINEENCTPKESIDYSGEWLITGTKADVVYAASAYNSGNNLKAYELTVYGNDKLIDKTEDIESCKMTLTKINEGSYKGKYTIQDANNLYLYAAGGESSNQLKAMNDISETDAGPYYWSILINEDGTYSVSANMTGRNKMLFNSASLLFSCYSSGQSPVTLIPYEKVVADPTPKIIVENAEIVVPASDTKATINYSIKNGSNGDVTVKVVEDDATMTDVSAVASVGTVTVSFGTNNDETQKSAKIKLSYEGASDVYVTIIQEAAIAEGYVVDVLDRAFTGVSGTTYTSWSGVESTSSSAVYAGNSAGGNSSIQLRSTNSNSGIVSTTSGGHAKKVVLEWNSSTSQGRTLNIYGSNTQYSAATDLYKTETQGTLLGTIVCGTSTELKIDGDYKYIGLRSNSGAMYLTKVEITWKEAE